MAFGNGEVVGGEAVDLAVAGDGFAPVGKLFVASGDGPQVVAGVVTIDFDELAVGFDGFFGFAFLELEFGDVGKSGDFVFILAVDAISLIQFLS